MPGTAHRGVLKPYQFKVKKPHRTKVERGILPPVGTYEQEAGGMGSYIQGTYVASKEEWRTAKALERWKIPYVYQVDIRGGRRVRGGQVIDFVAYNPWPIAVLVHGEHWHTGSLGADEMFKLAVIKKYYYRVVILWGNELGSQNEANDTVRRKLILGVGIE